MNYQQFLDISAQFSLGGLVTEQSHPHTVGLSDLAKHDLPNAIERMKDLDIHVFDVLLSKLSELNEMHNAIKDTFAQNHRVFICGCGSTGRLALTLETLYRQITGKDNVISFMAGGDVAIIASVEDFEDHPEFGAQQLNELNFQQGDLLISSTEGGETPWVIGAAQEASKISKPFFLYCNPDEVLTVQRSQEVFHNQNIQKINLTVGHQAITGSTRMQCSTVLTYAIGIALFYQEQNFIQYATSKIEEVKNFYLTLNASQFLSKFIELEANSYINKEYVFYRAKQNIAINILTDTTERCPTFSLHPFESILDNPINPSWCYFVMDDEPIFKDSLEAWQHLLYGRDPRALSSNYWQKYQQKVGLEKLLSHDISQQQIQRRTQYANGQHNQFKIILENNILTWIYTNHSNETVHQQQINLPNDILNQNILIKCLLNIHSTLLMGRLGRYESNIMIFVRPTNNKLIDRSIRYVLYLLKQNNINDFSYATICEILFEEIKTLVYGESIVLKTFNRIKSK